MNLKEKITFLLEINKYLGDVFLIKKFNGEGSLSFDYILKNKIDFVLNNVENLDSPEYGFSYNSGEILKTINEEDECYKIRKQLEEEIISDTKELSDLDFEKKYRVIKYLFQDKLSINQIKSLNSLYCIVLKKINIIDSNIIINFIKDMNQKELEFFDYLGFSFINIPCEKSLISVLFDTIDEKMEKPYKYLCAEELCWSILNFSYKSGINLSFTKNTKIKNEKDLENFKKNIKFIKEYVKKSNHISKSRPKKSFSLENYERFQFLFKHKSEKTIKSKKEIYFIARKINDFYEKENLALMFESESNDTTLNGKGWLFTFFIAKSVVEENEYEKIKDKIKKIVIEILNFNENNYKIDLNDLEKNFPESYSIKNLFKIDNIEDNNQKKKVRL